MKKLLVLGLVIVSLAVSSFAASYMLNSTKGGQGITYVSTTVSSNEIEENRIITTSNYNYRVNGGYYKVLGASIAASANNLFLAIGSGSSSTANYIPLYDVVIPMEPIGPAITDGPNGIQNFGLSYTNVWYEQGISGNVDYRGATLNIQVRSDVAGSQMIDGITALTQAYIKLERVLFGN